MALLTIASNSLPTMPIITFDRLLRIISTILNVLVAALGAFTDSAPVKPDPEPED